MKNELKNFIEESSIKTCELLGVDTYSYTFVVWGKEGHRQRNAFSQSHFYDFSEREITILEINADLTDCFDYTILIINGKNAQSIIDELDGQISDGIFENCNVGEINLIETLYRGEKNENN